MSDYDVKEESKSDSQPFEIYNFAGTYRDYYLTSDYLEHEFQSKIYLPVPGLKRSAMQIRTHDDDSGDLTIEIPISEQIVKDYAFQTTPPALQLTIYRFQRESANYAVYWKGPVTQISIRGEVATIRSPNKFGTILQGNIPNVYVQPPCNNVLFDNLCKVSRAANSLDSIVNIVNDREITISSIGAFADGWFIGGEIAVPARNERRMIVGQTGNILRVNYEFSKLTPGQAVQVTAGCDHSYENSTGCPKFQNQVNFGGCPFVPGESNNVFVSGLK